MGFQKIAIVSMDMEIPVFVCIEQILRGKYTMGNGR